MYENIARELNGKKIAILGFGREGKSSYRFIVNHCTNVDLTIIDGADIRESFTKEFPEGNVSFVIGANYLDNLSVYDMIIKTPGISLKDIDISAFKSKIKSQLELFLKYYGQQAIAITGTKGKSTTTSLIYEMILAQKANTFLMGNIGIPVFDKIEEYDESSTLVVEISSHQLEYLDYSSHIGVILNLFEDHLDKAGTLENYHNIKMKLFKNQKEGDYGLYFYDNEVLKNKVSELNYPGHLYAFSLKEKTDIYKEGDKYFFMGEEIYDSSASRLLLGEHNTINIVLALAVVKILGLDNELARNTAASFKPVEYRNEFVGKYDGINFYVDTLATIPEATIASLKALKTTETIIFGGMDRGIDYSSLIEYFNNSSITNFICMPSTGQKIGKEIKRGNVYFIESLKDAVVKAKEIGSAGSICLLSPAAASYEFYKDYKEKAEAFKKYIKE